tara:strand:- start:428 stop:826 length:399 start_codon:yes stop_codon:yes gene_type:complete
MPLLSKQERQTLTPDEKRSLRKQRREIRREERGPFLGIKMDKLEELAEPLILEIAGDLLPGEGKMLEVIDDLSEHADEFLTWTGLPTVVSLALEAVDGIFLRAIARGTLRPVVQRVYDRLKAEGKLDGVSEE